MSLGTYFSAYSKHVMSNYRWKAEQQFGKQLEAAQKERDAAVQEAQETRAEAAGLKATMEEAFKLIEIMKSKAEGAELKLTRTVENMKDDFAQKEKESKEIFARQIQRLQQGLEVSETSSHTALSHLAQTQAELETSQLSCNKLQQEVQAAHKEVEVLQNQLSENGALHEATANDLVKAEEAVQELKLSLESSNNKLQSTETKLKESHSFTVQYEKKTKEMESTVKSLSNQVQELEQKEEHLSTALNAAKEELKTASDSLDKMSIDCEMMQEDIEVSSTERRKIDIFDVLNH